jgi:hypothetical protein
MDFCQGRKKARQREPGKLTCMTPEEQNLLGKIVADSVVHQAMMPNANTVALNPEDFKVVQSATGSGEPSIIAGGRSLKVVEDPTVKPKAI